eukprot:gene22076-27035_t
MVLSPAPRSTRMSTMLSTLTSKGQVTIPQALRQQLGLMPGQAVTFDLSADASCITLRPAVPAKNPSAQAMKQRTSQLTALDTNVLARYYVQTEQTDAATALQCEHARALLESGKPLFVATTVALELEWVLRGFYKLEPRTVAKVFHHLLSIPQVQMQDRQALQSACDALSQGFDFADALHHASSRQCDALVTFDAKGFAKRATAKGWVPKVLVP